MPILDLGTLRTALQPKGLEISSRAAPGPSILIPLSTQEAFALADFINEHARTVLKGELNG